MHVWIDLFSGPCSGLFRVYVYMRHPVHTGYISLLQFQKCITQGLLYDLGLDVGPWPESSTYASVRYRFRQVAHDSSIPPFISYLGHKEWVSALPTLRYPVVNYLLEGWKHDNKSR